MKDLSHTLEQYALEFIGDGEHFLVEVEKSKGRKYTIVVDGDTGVSIDYCARLSRHISARIDEEMPEEEGEAFVYEVSSPGVGRPLKTERQYPQHIGRSIQFTAGGKEVTGKLKAIEKGTITVEEEVKEKGKKAVALENTYDIKQITEPKIIVSFK